MRLALDDAGVAGDLGRPPADARGRDQKRDRDGRSQRPIPPCGGAGDADAAEDGDDRGGGGEEAGEAGEADDRHQRHEHDPGAGAGEEDREGPIGALARRFCKPLVDKLAPREQEREADPAGGQRRGCGSSQDREAVERLDAAGAGRFSTLQRVAGAEEVGDEPGEGDEERDEDRRSAQPRPPLARAGGPERQERPDFRPQQRRRRSQPEDRSRALVERRPDRSQHQRHQQRLREAAAELAQRRREGVGGERHRGRGDPRRRPTPASGLLATQPHRQQPRQQRGAEPAAAGDQQPGLRRRVAEQRERRVDQDRQRLPGGAGGGLEAAADELPPPDQPTPWVVDRVVGEGEGGGGEEQRHRNRRRRARAQAHRFRKGPRPARSAGRRGWRRPPAGPGPGSRSPRRSRRSSASRCRSPAF